MTTKATAKTPSETNPETICKFSDRHSAWAFMRACDSAKISAGYPSLGPVEGFWIVRVAA